MMSSMRMNRCTAFLASCFKCFVTYYVCVCRMPSMPLSFVFDFAKRNWIRRKKKEKKGKGKRRSD